MALGMDHGRGYGSKQVLPDVEKGNESRFARRSNGQNIALWQGQR